MERSNQPIVVAKGVIRGHEASGSVVLETSGGGAVLRLEDYWIAEGAPDVRIYLTPDRNGNVDVPGAVSFDRVAAFSGTLEYPIPPETRLDEIAAVVVYCKAFSVTFGTAVLVHSQS